MSKILNTEESNGLVIISTQGYLNKDLGEELADVLFVLLCIANQTGINLQTSFDLKLKIKAKRDHKRHKNNPKLKL